MVLLFDLFNEFLSGIKAALTSDHLSEGQLIVFGTPAEEGGGGKAIMIEKGCFDDVDFCIMAHPYVENIIYHPELSLERFQITYHGRSILKAFIFLKFKMIYHTHPVILYVTCYL